MAAAEIHHTQTVDVAMSEPTNGLSSFTAIRPRLFAMAYRMLQRAAEAEDVVQDVWLRWQQTDRSAVQSVPAFLATTTTRLCLNIAKSARSRCEISVGPSLPEPVDRQADPELGAMRGAGLELAILMLLERLSPAERAAYILREAFDYSYRQIAGILRIGEANCRQLVVRARKHLADGRRASVTSTEQKLLLDALIHAARKGNLTPLEIFLAKDVTPMRTEDSLYVRHASSSPANLVAEFVATMSSKLWDGVTLCWGPELPNWVKHRTADCVNTGYPHSRLGDPDSDHDSTEALSHRSTSAPRSTSSPRTG